MSRAETPFIPSFSPTTSLPRARDICKCLGFFYLKKVDGKGGKYDVYVDGERKGTLDADFKGGWGNYGETQQILISKDSEKHTVEIKLAEGSTNTSLTILGIMES